MQIVLLLVVFQALSIPFLIDNNGFRQNEFMTLSGITLAGQAVPVDFTLSSPVTGDVKAELLLQSGPHSTGTQGDYPYDQYVVLQSGTSAWLADSTGARLGPSTTSLGVVLTNHGWAGASASLSNTTGSPATVVHWDLKLPASVGTLNVGRLALIATVTGAPVPPPPSQPPQAPVPTGFTYCAQENETCIFSGTREIKYGANGVFNALVFAGSVACTNASFGDPLVGTLKACFYANTVVSAPPPADPCITNPYRPTISRWPGTTGAQTASTWNPNGKAWVSAAFLTNPMRFESTDFRGCKATIKK